MRLLLARHGNTFASGETPRWIGLREDMPLTEEGREQARALGRVLREYRVKLGAVFCAELRRTREFAEIIRGELAQPVAFTSDSRLNEIDYGEWAGLSDAEVREKCGAEALEGWIKRSIWPANCGWAPEEAKLTDEVRSFALETAERFGPNETLLVVSSNGRLRYFLKLVSDEFSKRSEAGTFKIATGNSGVLETRKGEFLVRCWNQPPSGLGAHLES